MNTALKPFKDSTDLLLSPVKLKARAEKEGYLFFKGLLDGGNLSEVRNQILKLLDKRNLLDRIFPFNNGIGDFDAINQLDIASFNGYGIPFDLYMEIQKLEAFHKLAHHPALLNVFRQLFESDVLPHPRNIARVVLPHLDVKPTPPHQDFIHIQGTTTTWTTWFPLDDCPKSLGGLAVMEGSHHLGVLDVTAHQGAGGLEAILCDLDLEWIEGDYQQGDVLILHSHTVHKALPNLLGNQIRLSCDFRYQPAHLPIDSSSLHPHGCQDETAWKEIYEGWTTEEIKYYWKPFDLKNSEWDESIRWQKEKIC